MLITLLLLVALQSHFAEFLKGLSSLTFVYSTYPLVSDWYSVIDIPAFPENIWIISSSFSSFQNNYKTKRLTHYSLGIRSQILNHLRYSYLHRHFHFNMKCSATDN